MPRDTFIAAVNNVLTRSGPEDDSLIVNYPANGLSISLQSPSQQLILDIHLEDRGPSPDPMTRVISALFTDLTSLLSRDAEVRNEGIGIMRAAAEARALCDQALTERRKMETATLLTLHPLLVTKDDRLEKVTTEMERLSERIREQTARLQVLESEAEAKGLLDPSADAASDAKSLSPPRSVEEGAEDDEDDDEDEEDALSDDTIPLPARQFSSPITKDSPAPSPSKASPHPLTPKRPLVARSGSGGALAFDDVDCAPITRPKRRKIE